MQLIHLFLKGNNTFHLSLKTISNVNENSLIYETDKQTITQRDLRPPKISLEI
jgi:hypothetical protein